MSCQHDDGENCNRNGVPVEQTDMAPDIEVGEKRHREIPLCINGNAARDVARSHTEKNREKKIGKDEIEVPISLPKAIIDVPADFDRDTAQNQTPQNQKEGEIVTGKRRRHQAREDRDQCSAETEEPYLMPRPQRSNRRYNLPTFDRRLRNNPLQHAGAEVTSVQNNVDDEHEINEGVPDSDHTSTASPGSTTTVVLSSGPLAISRPVRPRKSRPSTK